MKMNTLIQEFSSLSYQEKEFIIEQLLDQWENHEGQLSLIMNELDEIRIRLPQCVHCQAEQTLRRAKINGIQRFSCKECGKYWMATHGTSLAGMHKRALWQKYIQAFEKGLSIRKAAQEVGVSIQTSFRWRHRLLSSITCYLPQQIGGIVESSDFQMPFSRKGERPAHVPESIEEGGSAKKNPETISVLMSVCRGKTDGLSSVIKSSELNADIVKRAISGKILPGSVIITKNASSFQELVESETIEQIYSAKKDKPGKRDMIHLKTAEQNQVIFLDFLTPFRGVATKYLQNYLNWHHYKEYMKLRIDKVRQALIASLTGDGAMEWIKRLTKNDTVIIT